MIERILIRSAWIVAFAGVVGAPLENSAAQSVATLQTEAEAKLDQIELDQIELDQILATSAFAVAKARMIGNKLTITGTTKGKRKKVKLDSAYKTTSSGKRVFSFSVKYMPPDCIAALTAEGKKLKVAVKNCGQTGPTGATGRKGKRGPQGEIGAAGPQGAPGDRGPRGNKGATGDAGPQGPDGPIGSSGFVGGTSIEDIDGGSVTTASGSGDFGFIGNTLEEELTGNVPIIAIARGAAQIPGDIFFDICYQALPGGAVEPATTQLFFEATSAPVPIGQTVGFEVPTTGTYRLGICADTDGEQLTVDWFILWLLGHQELAPDAALSATASPGAPWAGSVTTIRPGSGS